MATNPNKLSQFWQDLKRRNVVRVITVYTGAAFVILSLVDMIREPFELPNWSFKLVVVILSVGLIIAVILSWIYDIHPEGGIVKTEPADKIKPEEPLKSSKGWKVASYISFVVILVLIVLNIIPRSGKKEINDQSIAVLPFTNESPSSENEYVINGYMASVHEMLCHIKNLKVRARSSTEQFRGSPESIRDIARDLDVGYLLTASGQIYDNRIRLIVQLLDADENIIWSNPYDRQIMDVSDHIDIQSEIASLVAGALQAAITPDEMKLIEKVPTTSLTAYNYCLQGQEEVMKIILGREYGSSLEQAAHFFKMALEYDPGYARAYAELAMVSYYTYTRFTLTGDQYAADYFRSRNLDSMNLLADKALELDDRIANAYYVKGYYEMERGNLTGAMEMMNQALDLDPNYTMAMIGTSSVLEDLNDFVGSMELLHRAAGLEQGTTLAVIYGYFAWRYWEMDLQEPFEHYLNEFVSVSGDSLSYYTLKYYAEFQHGRFDKALSYAQAGYALDTTDRDAVLILGKAYLDLEQYGQAYPYYSRYFSGLDNSGDLDVNDMNRMGYLLSMLGKKEEAQQYFQEMIAHCKRHIRMNTTYGRQGASFDIAGVYSFLGKRDSAYHYLEMYSEKDRQIAYMIAMLQELDPLFEPIRHEERFQQLLYQMEVKYQAEHERVKQWLEENDML
jgi:TolB-like protein/tetratricopeptide (TPR) repeat protein